MKKFLSFVLLAMASTSLFAVPAIPTFDYSNLLAAIESTYRAIEFYEQSARRAEEYISKVQELGKAIDSGDREKIVSGIKAIVEGANEVIKAVEAITKRLEKQKYDAEVASKTSVLKILNVLSNPSIRNIKDYLDEQKSDSSAFESAKNIANDAKKAAEIILFDYSKSADEAIEKLDNKYVDLARKLSENLNNLKDKQSKYSTSLTAQETLGMYMQEITQAGRILDDTKKEIDIVKNQIKEGKECLEENLSSWANIDNKLGIYSKEGQKLKRNASSLKEHVDRLK